MAESEATGAAGGGGGAGTLGEAADAVGKRVSREDYFEVRKLVGPGATKIADTGGSRK